MIFISAPRFTSRSTLSKEIQMQLGTGGLGRMGANMVRRLAQGRHECVVYDVHAAAVKRLQQPGVVGSSSLEELVARLAKPCAV